MFLGYAELFHEELHGMDEFSDPQIQEHYIAIITIKNPINYLKFLHKTSSMDRELYYQYICENNHDEIFQHLTVLFHRKNQIKKLPFVSEHKTIRNFLKIQECLYTPQLDLFEKKILPTGESVCFFKTFWIKCIQRKWKKICQHNKKQLDQMKTMKYIKKREYEYQKKQLIGIKGMWYIELT